MHSFAFSMAHRDTVMVVYYFWERLCSNQPRTSPVRVVAWVKKMEFQSVME
jgi:hypothetical protein